MIEVDGADELVRDFTEASLLAGVKARGLVERGGEKVAEHAQERAPKRRPQLAPSITSEMVDVMTAEIGPENALGGGYGHIVEKGLAGRPPQPYLNPALDDARAGILDSFQKLPSELLP